MTKKTPEEIYEEIKKLGNYEFHSTYTKDQALAELDAYYTLSNDELREMLPKKETCGKSYDCESNCPYQDECDIKQLQHKAIDACFSALRGRVKRGLSVKEIESIFDKHTMIANSDLLYRKDLAIDIIRALYKGDTDETR